MIDGTCERGWFSGRIVPCHGTDPGSIPGSRKYDFLADSAGDFGGRGKFVHLLMYTSALFTIGVLKGCHTILLGFGSHSPARCMLGGQLMSSAHLC